LQYDVIQHSEHATAIILQPGYAKEQNKPIYGIPWTAVRVHTKACHSLHLKHGAGIIYTTQYMAACGLPKSSDQPAVKLALILQLPPIRSCTLALTVNMSLVDVSITLAVQMET